MVRSPPVPLNLTCRAGCGCQTCSNAHISPVESQFSRAATSTSSAFSTPHQHPPRAASAQATPRFGGVSMMRSTSVPVLTYAEHAEFTASIGRRSMSRAEAGLRSRVRPSLAGVFDGDGDVEMDEPRGTVSLPLTPNPGDCSDTSSSSSPSQPPSTRVATQSAIAPSPLPNQHMVDRSCERSRNTFDCTPRTSRSPIRGTRSSSPTRPISTLSRADARRLRHYASLELG